MNKVRLISEIFEQVKRLGADAPEPEMVCWLIIGSEDSAGLYCPDCAEKILAWLCGGGEQPDFGEHEEYPNYADIEIENNYIFYADAGYEAECNIEHCAHCGCHLDATLLEEGIDSELERLEGIGLHDADDWRHFQDVCDGIEYVEADWFPDKEIMTADEIREARQLYKRTLALAQKYLAQEEPDAA